MPRQARKLSGMGILQGIWCRRSPAFNIDARLFRNNSKIVAKIIGGTVPLITFQGKKNKNRVIGGRFFALQSEASSSAVIIIRPKKSTLIAHKSLKRLLGGLL